jgi:hypothetical protein
MLSGFRIRVNVLQLILIVGVIVILWNISKLYTLDNYRRVPINSVNSSQTSYFNGMYLQDQMNANNILSNGMNSRNCMRR